MAYTAKTANFRKNHQNTFFVENLILYKKCVLIIFSKISGFGPIGHFWLTKVNEAVLVWYFK